MRREAYLDIETTSIKTPGPVKFVAGGIYWPDTGEYWDTPSVFEMVRYIHDNPGVYYGHNAGRFDSKLLLPATAELGLLGIPDKLKTRVAVNISGSLFKLYIGKSEVIDTLHLMKAGLRSLAHAFGGRKKGWGRYGSMRWDTKTRRYLRQDCEVLAEVHRKFKAALDVDSNTIGGAAVKLWRRHGGKNPERQCMSEGKLCAFGGRQEIYNMTCASATAYDVNGMYSHIMSHDLPVGPFHRVEGGRLDATTACAYVRVRVRVCHVPPLPYYRHDRLYFPMGDFDAYLSGPECALAKALGAVREVYWQVRMTGRAPFCRAYVNALWGRRMEAKKAGRDGEALACKFALNSLSGKFAESEEAETYVIDRSPPAENTEWLNDEYRIRAVSSWRPVPHAQPIIYAWITGAGRVLLWRRLSQMDKAALYCHTDSVHVRGVGWGFDVGEKIGQWKREGTGPAHYLQCGIYRHAGKDRVRGFASTRRDPIFGRLEAKGEATLVTLDGVATVVEDMTFHVRRWRKTLRTVYSKRKLYPDGSTRAWTAEEIDAGAPLEQAISKGKK